MKKRFMLVALVLLLATLAFAAAACGTSNSTTTTAAPTGSTAAMTDTTAAMTDTTAAMTDTTAAMTDSTAAMTDTTVAAAGPATGEPITIGMCAPQTGAFSSAWPMEEQGIQVALDLVNNNGGINGHPLAITVVDDKSDPTVAVSQMTKLITQNKVQVVLGSMAPPAGQAMMPLAGKYKVVQIRDVPTIKEAAETQPYVFFTGESASHITKSLLQQIKVAGWKNILGIGDQIPLCQDILAVLKDQASAGGYQIDYMADSWPLDITDVTPIVNKIWSEYQAKKPDVLFLMATNDCVPIIKALRQKGLTIPIQCPPAAIMPALFNMGKDVVEGLYVLGPGITDPSQLPADFYGLDAIKAFDAAFKAKFNQQPTLFGADGNDKVATIVEALKKAGDGADGTKIAAALETFKDFPEVQGTFTFSADNHVGLTGPLCEWQCKDGKFVLVQVLDVNK